MFLTKPNSQKFFIDGKAITTRNDLPLYAGVPASNIPLPNITGNDTPPLLSSDSYLPYYRLVSVRVLVIVHLYESLDPTKTLIDSL